MIFSKDEHLGSPKHILAMKSALVKSSVPTMSERVTEIISPTCRYDFASSGLFIPNAFDT